MRINSPVQGLPGPRAITPIDARLSVLEGLTPVPWTGDFSRAIIDEQIIRDDFTTGEIDIASMQVNGEVH